MKISQNMSNKNLRPNISQRQSSQSLGTVTPISTRNLEEDDLHLSLNYFDEDEDFDDDEDEDYEDYSLSEGDYESDVTLEEVQGGGLDLPKNEKSESQNQDAAKLMNGAKNGPCTDLVPAGQTAYDPYSVDSDEENELLKGIKDEIKGMVREEMQSELAVYEHKVKSIEAGRLPSVAGAPKEEDKYPDLANMEPELREAYIKMWKLDRILEKRVKKEREVKRERILLERRLREEITNMQTAGRVQRDIKTNTEKFLALELPPSHNEGVIVDERPVTPVFQTQVNEQDLQGKKGSQTTSASRNRSSRADSRESSAASSRTNNTESQKDEGSSQKGGRKQKRKKDFIKRNKELAANANDMVVMTDDEKKRLQDLLMDVDALPDIPEEGTERSVEDNPFQVVVHPGEGFLPTDSEWRTLSSIDQRLQSIMPEEDFRSIASSSLSSVPQQRLFTRVGVQSNLDFDYESYGERALIETKEEREVQTKLKEIEERLTRFQNVEEEESNTPHLTEEQMDSLLNDCVRSLSRVSLPPDTPHSVATDEGLESARAHLLLNPPRLSDEMLQKLLSEAHFPLSTRLMALQDDDSKSAHSGEEGGAIRAETWKIIADETLSDDDEHRVSGASEQGSHTLQRQTYPPPRPSLSDTNIHPPKHRGGPYLRHSASQLSDSDGRDSRVSLPEISTSPFLINTRQGQGQSCVSSLPNNDPAMYRAVGHGTVRMTSSLDGMVHNDFSANPLRESSVVSGGNTQRLSGTPLSVEELGSEQGQTTPMPHPPQSSDRHSSSGLGGKSRPSVPRDGKM